jgi:DHA1 family multidrug resistance protein-like MFS transporter
MYRDSGGGNGRSFAALLAFCCLVTFGCYFAVSMRLPVVPLYARGVGISTAQIGVINAAFYLMAGCLSLPSGMLSDLFGRKRLALTGAVVVCLGMLLLFFGRSYLHLTGLYLLLGGGIAAFGPTMMAWVAEFSPPTHLGRAYGWYTTALFCGLGLGPAAGGAVGMQLGLRPVFLIGTGIAAVTLWAIGRYMPAPEHIPGRRPGEGRWRRNMGTILANRPLIGCWAATFGACIVAGMFFSFMPLYADNRGLTVGQIGIVFLVQSVSNAMSRIPFGAVSDRVGQRKHQALAGAVLATLAIAGFAAAASYVQFILAAIALGVSMAVAFTSIGALIAETVERRFRGLAMGGYNTCIYFGLMTGSIGLGPLIEAVGFARGFLLTGAANLPFVAVFVWSMLGYTRRLDPSDLPED